MQAIKYMVLIIVMILGSWAVLKGVDEQKQGIALIGCAVIALCAGITGYQLRKDE